MEQQRCAWGSCLLPGLLRAWLQQPGRGPALEFQGALKLFFADSGAQQDALTTIDAVASWTKRMLAFGAGLGREYIGS